MELLIVSGMSGSGKSKAIQILEDIGFFCVDNVPPPMISKFSELMERADGGFQKMALVVDARGGMLDQFISVSEELKEHGVSFKLLYLDADDAVLLRRYKEQRRRHPLADRVEGNLEEAISLERLLLIPIRQRADYVLDSSDTSVQELGELIRNIFSENCNQDMLIRIVSFGYKNGLPKEADLVFDLRCLRNPFYVPELRDKTGLTPEIQDYVMNNSESAAFWTHLTGLIDFLLPLYRREGKSQLVIALGCTGGKHRSVTLADRLGRYLKAQDLKINLRHRDINR